MVSKQLLIYGHAQPVSRTKHRNWSVDLDDDFSFAREINAVPLSTAEFFSASEDFAIVFIGLKGRVVPVTVMGMRKNQDLFVQQDGHFDAHYVPGFLRRYPFIFASHDEGEDFVLCIDESFSGCNQAGQGERLFDDKGQETAYLQGVLEFLKGYQGDLTRTRSFCQTLQALDLLEAVGTHFEVPSSHEQLALSGFMVVNREKLNGLAGDQLSLLAKSGALEQIYTHLHSLRNLNGMLQRIEHPEQARAI